MFNKRDIRQFARRQYRGAPQVSNAWRVGLLIVVLIAALLYAVNSRAQEFTGCEPADYDALTSEVLAQLAVLADDPVTGFTTLRGTLDMAQAKCTGGVYTQDTNPNGIVGPLTFDGTVYEITLTMPDVNMTTGYVQWTTLEGDCGFSTMLSLPGIAGGSETSIVEFEGCEAIFDVTVTGDDWLLMVKKLK